MASPDRWSLRLYDTDNREIRALTLMSRLIGGAPSQRVHASLITAGSSDALAIPVIPLVGAATPGIITGNNEDSFERLRVHRPHAWE